MYRERYRAFTSKAIHQGAVSADSYPFKKYKSKFQTPTGKTGNQHRKNRRDP